MATVITSIGAKSETDDPVNGQMTMTGSSGSGTPWTGDLSVNSAPTANVGDMVFFDNVYYNCGYSGCTGPADIIYLITAVDSTTLTIKYISGGASVDPMSLKSDSYGYTTAQPYVLRFYSTISTWNVGLDDSGLYTLNDIAQGELYKDSDFTLSSTQWNSGGQDTGISDARLTVPVSQRHDGTAGSGVKFKLASSSVCGMIYLYYDTGTASNDIRRLCEWIEYDGQSYGQPGCQAVCRLAAGGNYAYYGEFNHCILHNFELGVTGGSSYNYAIEINSQYSCAHNNIIYDITTESSSSAAGVKAIGMAQDQNNQLMSNNTIYNIQTDSSGQDGIGISMYDDSSIKCINNIVVSCADDCFSNADGSEIDGNNNLSSDSTAPGSNSVTGASAADLFENPTVGSEDLHLKDGAEALRAGADLGTGYTIGSDVFGGTTTSITTLNIDIDGRNRDSEGDDWDIGADQCEDCSEGGAVTNTAFMIFMDM